MKTEKIIVIHPDGAITEHVAKNPVTLGELQFHVGGYIEVVRTTLGENVIMIVNEEGKLNELPENETATAYADLAGWDYIAGRAVLARQDGEEIRPFGADELRRILAIIK